MTTCTWKRPRLTEAFMSWWEGLEVPDYIELVGAAVGDYTGRSDFWRYGKCANDPLGFKHNVSLALAAEQNPDAVLFVGSDNLVTRDYIPNAVEAMRQGALLTESAGCYIWDQATDRLCRQNVPETGAARIYSRELLDAMDWQLWSNERTIKMDTDARQRVILALKIFGLEWKEAKRKVAGGLLNIKGLEGVNMWSYDYLMGCGTFEEIPLSGLDLFDVERLGPA